MKYSSKLFYRDRAEELRVLDYGDYNLNINAVNDQAVLVTAIVELGLYAPASPVFCLIENNK